MSLRIDRSRAGVSPAFRVFKPALRLSAAAATLGAVILLGGCASSRGGSIPYNVQDFGSPDAPSATIGVKDDYKIGPLDTLAVKVFQVADLSGDYDVDLTGNISMPLIGNVKVIDMTPAEADAKITQLLSQKYLQNPDVAVGVKASQTNVVTIDGAVNGPGTFPVIRPVSLMQAIAMAHGTTETANPHRVAVFRQIQGQRMAAAFDLTSIRKGEAEDPRVYRGDIIVVDGSQVKEIQRQVLQSLPLVSVFTPFALR